jgi:hypothetical protein
VRPALLAVALGAVLLAPQAAAHRRSLSYSSWVPDDAGARVHARVSQLDLSRLGLAFRSSGRPDDPVALYLARRLVLLADGVPCPPTRTPEPREASEGWVIYAWRVACPSAAQRALESALFLDVAPSHLHFARLDDPAGPGVERVLSEAEPRWQLPGDAAAPGAPAAPAHTGSTLPRYLALGVEHILTGWDHLAFVLALLLLAATLGEVAALVTSFTVAHSVTLALATLGVVQPEAAAVEALIGFSIALVATENGWILAGRGHRVPLAVTAGLVLMACLPGGAVPGWALLGLALFSLCHFGLLAGSARPARLRVAVAFAFGLVHGFGFAGVLAALELPTARLVPALFGFNVGVELGQLGVVVVVWPLLRLLARAAAERPGRLVAEAGSAAICGLGLYWFLMRHFG